jgi:hypothetical protein
MALKIVQEEAMPLFVNLFGTEKVFAPPVCEENPSTLFQQVNKRHKDKQKNV